MADKLLRHRIDRALNDPDVYVRIQAVSHPKATLSQITRGLTDSDERVRAAAVAHPKALPAHIYTALMDDSKRVRAAGRAASKYPTAETNESRIPRLISFNRFING